MGFIDQMKQLMEVKQKMEEAKTRLNAIEVDAENDYVKVTANGNRKIVKVAIKRNDDSALLEAKLIEATNQVLEKSDNIMQSEMMSATKGMMPNGFPGLG